ncbi:hypothetical protein ACFE04_010673 [Oxalis oulophora]
MGSIENPRVSIDYGDLGSNSKPQSSEGLSLSMNHPHNQKEDIDGEDACFVYINDASKTNERLEFAGNSIRTAKYSIITFLPKNLFEQFHRVAYVYFLIIAILNQLPQLAVFGRTASVLPLAFVLAVTAVKDAYEDWRRQKADKIENNRFASVLINNKFVLKKWKDIQVGEVIKVHADETLPCDIVLLSTSDPTGVVYVQTINLDGESNLKTRYAKQETLSKIPDKEPISGLVKCEKPNRNIYGFHATMEIDGKRLSLGPANIILRGCELKNTSWAIGVVVYAGRETKAMLNNSGAPSKRSRIETQMNFEMIILSLFLALLCTIVSACAGVWLWMNREKLVDIVFYHKKDFSKPKVDNYNYYGLVLEIFFTFLKSDVQMYDEASDACFQCRALNINEDLGQVKYVFSDKTGTLTENKMEFKCASVWGVDYSNQQTGSSNEQDGYFVQEHGKVFRPKMKVATDPELLRLVKSENDTEKGKHVFEFFSALAACNTIVPIVIDTSDANEKLIDYQGESPDEQALVYAAAAYGFMLMERTSGHIVINVQGEMLRLNVLGLHEFDSDRKRMSVILGFPDKSVRVFVKGADTTMLNVIDKSLNINIIHSTEAHLHTYSSVGLRTLVIGMRDLSALEFEQWHSSFEAASTALLGRTAKLQLDSNPEGVTSAALIIDGTSLVYILDTELEEELFELANQCSAVLCCRVAPFQKAGIVALVKNRTSDMTLAIGDGANDVSMIQMADVGVGISGQEGRQAVMASDFAMGQFRFIVPLLLVHGHWNYQRMGYMILYNFYRNAVFVLVLFWYTLCTCFTLTTAINEWSSVLYSVIYTAVPTIVVAVVDKDLARSTLLKHPQLYGAGHLDESYNKPLFWLTMIDTLWQSIVIFFVPLLAYWGSEIDGPSLGDLWTLASVIVVNLHLAMDVVEWNWITHSAIWGSICATWICVIVLDAVPSLVGYWAIFNVAKQEVFWLCLLCIIVGSLVPRYVIKLLSQFYCPSDIQIYKEVEKFDDDGRREDGLELEMNEVR